MHLWFCTMAADTVDSDLAMWIGGGLLTIIAGLIVIIYRSKTSVLVKHNKEISDLKTDIDNLKKEISLVRESSNVERSERLVKCEGEIKTINTLEQTITNLSIKIDDLNKRIDEESRRRQDKHDNLAQRVFGELDKTKEKVGDIDATCQGFGATFISRSEHQHDKDQLMESMRELKKEHLK